MVETPPNIHYAVGIHPCQSVAVAQSAPLRAFIGKIFSPYLPICLHFIVGLDYVGNNQSEAVQIENLRWCIQLALELDKVLVLHCRSREDWNAYIKVLDVFQQEDPDTRLRLHFHWFSGLKSDAVKLLLEHIQNISSSTIFIGS